ncbi:YdcH family protein [Syntrophotalea acetylenica]|jgi:hypothetical protein|uniref:DUF465 domain-containing protein n=2 Tax=Syntrophotalea TaxID=2812025 RepID=A0A1L3GJC5_SYNAC|nr:DUF465 domain-containing protein [Syntrophotalea acetylenica]APG26043.1 hypothetical protein A7E75_14275 [Syntrophotalea acetylenica]APG44106.1 hypothetical protein A6070_08300 [Syntrophotalea acetylenica]MDY0261222.1 DUF465 domain-containing protein [Syntrophotalea acetylenica]
MEEQDLGLVQRLCDASPRYRRLYEEHVLLERELEMLDQREILSTDEELQRKKVQKLKLAGKDEMAQIMRLWKR